MALPVYAVPECGDVITSAEVLEKELFCAEDPALTVIGPSGSLTMISGGIECSNNNVGIVIEGTGAFVTGEQIDDCSIGILVGGKGFHSIFDIEVGDASNIGIQVLSGNNNVADCEVEDRSATGVSIIGDNNKVGSCVITESGGSGIQVDGDGFQVIKNTVSHSFLSGIEIGRASGRGSGTKYCGRYLW
ncbi:right-handed parallel beta-helix repeat-containing protein [Microbulbifer sp. TRSA002]|uniref:right-handed parallel beta-helix repeat-containing protein n=1 Tax=Microbulbifer sp. TRSA002 TaxID=3243382 RepID=UPI00403A067B